MPARDTLWRRIRRRLAFGAREDVRLQRDINDEIDAHLSARIDYLIARGLTPEAARARAIERFGNVEAARVVLHADARLQYRRVRWTDRLESLRQDVRYVARTLARRPAFTFGVVLTFALGLGINVAIFRVADVVLFRAPAAVRDAASIREVESTVTGADTTRYTTFSWPDTERIRAAGVFQGMSAGTTPRQLSGTDGWPVAVSYSDAAFFGLLGVPIVGRGFQADEARPGAQQAVAVVSHQFWRRRLDARPLSERPSLALAGRTYDVIGIATPGFQGIDLDPTDVWLPLGAADLGRGQVNGVPILWYQTEMARPIRIIGVPAPDTSDQAASRRLTSVLAGASQVKPSRTIALRPIVPVGRAADSESVNRVILRLVGVAGLVLLIAAANATNLLLARGVSRQPELAVRTALGASRGRLCGLLLVESTMLALAGGAAAALSAAWTSEALRRLLFPDGRWTSAGLDVRAVFVVGALAVAAGLAAGLAPALQATGAELPGSLKDGRARGTGRSRRARAGLLVTQTAFALTLLVASGLLVASLLRLHQTRLGFDPPGLVSITLEPAQAVLSRNVDPAALAGFVNALRAGPALHGLALASAAPFGVTSRTSFVVPGSTYSPPSANDAPLVTHVSPDYFEILGTRVVWGRALTTEDVATGGPVSVVNASMARAYWGPTLPPDACILIYGQSCARVVGIVEDTRESPAAVAPMRYYLPLYPSRPGGVVLARTTVEGARDLADRARAAVPSGYRATIDVVSDRVDRALRPWRTAAWLFVALGGVALALACGGIYSVMSYVAVERRHEIGVRMALGASRRDVLILIIRDGLRLVSLGAVIGIGIAALTGHLLGSLLFAVSPFEPVVYATSVTAVLLAALLATWHPAGRAARVDAAVALRQD